MFVLNFYSPIFVDQLKRGRKTATIRLGDKSRKYERGQLLWVTIGHQHSPREKIFTAVIDDVEVKKARELSPRDIEHDSAAIEHVNAGRFQDRGNLGCLVGVVIVVAEDGDHGHADVRKLGDERLRLGRFARPGEVAGEQKQVGFVLQIGQ